MANATKVSVEAAAEQAVHPLKKNHMFISSKTVDYDNLTAIESVAMSLALVLAITAGVTTALS